MYVSDHPPPHFHVRFGEHKARVEIATGDILEGRLPVRAERMVREWAELHRAELVHNWEPCTQRLAPEPVDPLA